MHRLTAEFRYFDETIMVSVCTRLTSTNPRVILTNKGNRDKRLRKALSDTGVEYVTTDHLKTVLGCSCEWVLRASSALAV